MCIASIVSVKSSLSTTESTECTEAQGSSNSKPGPGHMIFRRRGGNCAPHESQARD